MVPPRSRDSWTDLEAVPAKVMLQALVHDVSEARDDIREIKNAQEDSKVEIEALSKKLTIVAERQQGAAEKILDHERRIADMESKVRDQHTTEALCRAHVDGDIASIKNQLGVMAPLIAAHEQLIQQGKGAIWASRAIWALVGFLFSGTALAIYHMIKVLAQADR